MDTKTQNPLICKIYIKDQPSSLPPSCLFFPFSFVLRTPPSSFRAHPPLQNIVLTLPSACCKGQGCQSNLRPNQHSSLSAAPAKSSQRRMGEPVRHLLMSQFQAFRGLWDSLPFSSAHKQLRDMWMVLQDKTPSHQFAFCLTKQRYFFILYCFPEHKDISWELSAAPTLTKPSHKFVSTAKSRQPFFLWYLS